MRGPVFSPISLRRVVRDLRSGAMRGAWALAMLVGSLRRARNTDAHLRKHIFRTQVRGMRLSLPEGLSDALRGTWLRIRRDDSGAA